MGSSKEIVIAAKALIEASSTEFPELQRYVDQVDWSSLSATTYGPAEAANLLSLYEIRFSNYQASSAKESNRGWEKLMPRFRQFAQGQVLIISLEWETPLLLLFSNLSCSYLIGYLKPTKTSMRNPNLLGGT